MAQDKEAQIRARAHAIWESEGRPHGRDELHWDQATREIGGDEPEPEIGSGEQEAEDAIDVVQSAKAVTARKTARPKKA
ncbi:MAG: DUF2934 domain-containing protein [Sphingobium sp.]